MEFYVIIEMNMNSVEIMMISAIEAGDVDLLKVVNESVVPELEALSGVAQVSVSGGSEEYIKVELDETLMNLTCGDFPKTSKRMEEEKKVIHLTLLAGANPNYYRYHLGSVFNSFWNSKKGYGLLELLKDDRFEPPRELQDFYESFCWRPVFCSFSNEEFLLCRQENRNRADLIYTLFQKGMYPTNPKVFEKLEPIVLERDPDFFNKKKKEVLTKLQRAKTPIQIYNAIMGKQKERQ